MWAPVHVTPNEIPLSEHHNPTHTWFEEIAVVCPPDTSVVSAILHEHHWTPVCVTSSHDRLCCTTTSLGVRLLEDAFPDLRAVMEVNVIDMETKWQGDCGFQAIAWLKNLHQGPTNSNQIEVEECVNYRFAFLNHCIKNHPSNVKFPSDIKLGGMIPSGKTDNIELQLQQLLETHGVPVNASTQRASSIIDQLGRKTISQILRSAKSWKDLKAQANLHVPKVQLVLPGELEQLIQNRLKEGTPFGRHKQKKGGTPSNKGIIQLQPEDICIPHGIFRSGSSQPIAQIPKTHIGPDATGIVIVNAFEATPYIKLNRPVSSQGLAMLVLDHESTTVHGQGQVIRFPATCNKTGEPMLLSGRLIQIGSVEISRNEPTQKLKVEEEETKVIRILAYRDEIEPATVWGDFATQPVKQIVKWTPALQNIDQQVVLDVWDRQWVNLKLDKVRPQEAQIFLVTVRVLAIDLQPLLSLSGQQGLYFEPRTADGRSPCPQYRVLWMAKLDRDNVNIAIQTATHWSCIVRSGNRIGIRTKEQDAETIHQLHRPNTPFIDAARPKQFAAGPFPFGSTKDSLSKIFTKWGWEARPLQPRARASDGTGIIWTVLAGQPPEFEIYQLHHGDVLISELTSKRVEVAGPKHGVLASAKTIAALHEPKPDAVNLWNVQGDPWQYWQQDKSQRTSEQNLLTHQQVQQIEANLEKKIQAKVAHQAKDDQNMQVDESERLAQLEQRFSQFEQQAHATAVHQQRQHDELRQQVGGLQAQIEITQTNMNQVLDQRFDEQLAQIERLFSKKARQE